VAFHEITGHTVAVKILNKKRLKQYNVMDKLKREIKTTREFNHPHIIKHFEFINTSSDIFVINEYASGGELFELIQKSDKVGWLC
jgi:5'-AMP-activated protein kinase catalytic alpha subunit